MANLGFPWEEDAQRAKRSKKYRNKASRYRKAKAVGPKYTGHPKREPGWYKEYLKSDHWKNFRLRYYESKHRITVILGL